jgi:hypothetical protein
MASLRKIIQQILSGRSDGNVRFADLQRVLGQLGFGERVRGSHFIYTRDGVVEIVYLQPMAGGRAKPYQVKQVRELMLKYGWEI